MSDDKDEEEKPVVAKTAVDLQRLKLMKLMKNPEKPVILPERPKSKNTPTVPEFVRNVMGSSAGAGSGEFHVYRHLRRKEYARQKFIQEKGRKELLDEEYHRKLEENKRIAEEITAKKRAKRLKKKQKWKQRKRAKPASTDNKEREHSSAEDSSAQESNDENIDIAETEKGTKEDETGESCISSIIKDEDGKTRSKNEFQKGDSLDASSKTVADDEVPHKECTNSSLCEESCENRQHSTRKEQLE